MAEGLSLKRFLPRGLFGRSLIIIVAPIVLLQAIIAYVFFERDLDTTTRRLARDVAADMALLVALEDNNPSLERERLRALAARQLDYRIRFLPGQDLPPFHGTPDQHHRRGAGRYSGTAHRRRSRFPHRPHRRRFRDQGGCA